MKLFSALLVSLIFMVSSLAEAKSKGSSSSSSSKSSSQMGTFDLILSPLLSGGGGVYTAEPIDQGKYNGVFWGMRGALKTGPVLFGAEYLEGSVNGTSSRTVSAADRSTHPNLDGSRSQSWGWSLGLTKGRWILWYGHYGYNKLKKEAIISGVRSNFVYEGMADKLELNFRFTEWAYIGAFYRMQKFDKYSSSTPLAESLHLNPDLKVKDHGFTLSFNMPFSYMMDLLRKK